MNENVRTFDVEEVSLGDKMKGDRIVFKTREDLEQALKEIDNGRDIYAVEEDGTATLLLNRMINTKVYDGSIKLSARIFTKEEVKEE